MTQIQDTKVKIVTSTQYVPATISRGLSFSFLMILTETVLVWSMPDFIITHIYISDNSCKVMLSYYIYSPQAFWYKKKKQFKISMQLKNSPV